MTDAGYGYLKAMGTREGIHTLVCEWVCTQLAKWFGLRTFDFSIINVEEFHEIAFLNQSGESIGKAIPGPAFITRSENGDVWSGTSQQLEAISNIEDLTRLVVFDTWTLNCDRYSQRRKRCKYNNVFLSEEGAPPGKLLLIAMDHTHCFTCGGPLKRRLADIGNVKSSELFGLFPQFRPLLQQGVVQQACVELRRIDRDTVRSFTATVPREWELTKPIAEALERLVVDRARYLSDRIEDQLFPQRTFDFEQAEDSETSA